MYRKLLSVLLCLCLVWGVAAAEEVNPEDNITTSRNAESTDATDLDLIYQVENDDGTTTPLTDVLVDTDFDGKADTAVVEEVTEEHGTVNLDTNTYETKVDVTVQIADQSLSSEPPKYNVEIVWGNMYFAWGAVGEGSNDWDPEEHSYTVSGPDGETLDKEWYLISPETLEEDYMTADDIDWGVDYMHRNGVTTTQAHVLVFNHSNRAVYVHTALSEEGYGVVPVMHPLEDTNVAVMAEPASVAVAKPDGTGSYQSETTSVTNYRGDTVDGYTKCLFDLAPGVEGPENRYHPFTSAAMEVELTHEPSEEFATKTQVATMTVTLVNEGSRVLPGHQESTVVDNLLEDVQVTTDDQTANP